MASGGGTVPFRTIGTSEIKSRFLHLAQSSQFRAVLQVGRLPFTEDYDPQGGRYYDDLSLMCTNASLPGSSFSTSENNQDYYGINQKFAYRRDFDDLNLEFYVDGKYNTIKFFEQWMDYIASPGDYQTVGTDQKNLYNVYRFQYPEKYKVIIDIHKFDKDYEQVHSPALPVVNTGTKNDIVYTFVNAFPRSISSIPVSYEASEILKCSVTFAYDRYFVNRGQRTVQESSPTTRSGSPTDTQATRGLPEGVASGSGTREDPYIRPPIRQTGPIPLQVIDFPGQ